MLKLAVNTCVWLEVWLSTVWPMTHTQRISFKDIFISQRQVFREVR